MEMFSGSGDGTFVYLSRTFNNTTVTLDAIQKDEEIDSNEGPTATPESNWKGLSQSLQTSSGHILAHQPNNQTFKTCSMLEFNKQTKQSKNPSCTAVLHRETHTESKQHCSNDRTSEISAIVKTFLPLNCHEKSSSVDTNITRQSVPHLIVLNTDGLSTHLYNQQQHANTPIDSSSQALLGHFGVILAQGQTIKLCEQNDYMPKHNRQQKYAPQKAIAVVSPLTQTVVAGVTLPNNLTKVKGPGIEIRAEPNKNEYQPCISNIVQSASNGSGEKALHNNTLQTMEVPSKSVIAARFHDCVKDHGPVEANEHPGLCECLSSVRLNSISTNRNDDEHPNPPDNKFSTTILNEDNAAVAARNSEESRMDKLSDVPVDEWSLQQLCILVTELEQIQKSQQTGVPSNDLSTEILKLYWNGDYHKFCNSAKSDIYINIMKEVRCHRGTEHSVILQGVSRERLSEIASSFYILEHDIAPPKMVYTSSWMNLNEKLDDIDEELDKEHFIASLMALLHKTKYADKKVKPNENIKEPKNEKIQETHNALSKEEQQSPPLYPEHQNNSTVKDDIVRKEPVTVSVQNTYFEKETKGQDGMTPSNVTRERAQSETPSSDAGDDCMKPENLLNFATTSMTSVLDKNEFADCVSVEMSIFPPEKAAREPDEKVQKDDVQILEDGKVQNTLKLFDQEKLHIDTDNQLAEESNDIKMTGQMESYCCLAKWFQVLGYRSLGLCKCERAADLSHHLDNEVNALKHSHFPKIFKLANTKICRPNDKRRAKKKLGYRNTTGKKSVTTSSEGDRNDDDVSMDNIEIIDVITNYEDVLKIANQMSEQLMETPHIAHASHVLPPVRKLCQQNPKKIKVPVFKTKDAPINLALFGTSNMRQHKTKSRFKSSDKVETPPERIHVKIDSGRNEYPNSSKQQVWNSWKKTYVPSNMSSDRKSKKRKTENKTKEKNSVITITAFDLNSTLLSQTEDAQPHGPNPFSLASADKRRIAATDQSRKKHRKSFISSRKDKIWTLNQNKLLVSFKFNNKWNRKNDGSKRMRSSLEPALAADAGINDTSKGIALNFRVLPESFNISGHSSSEEGNRSTFAVSGAKVNTVIQMKKTWDMSGNIWCVSPKKKQRLQITQAQPNKSGPSTFQEFKKKYEEQKQSVSN